VRIGIVGCGYVAEYYLATLPLHPELQLVGVADRDDARARRFAEQAGVRAHDDVEHLLADGEVELVVNLTDPRSHAAVTRAALEAGRHVYTEKPLAVEMAEAEALVALAESRGLALASAPCSLLGETAQTMWRAVRAGTVGRVRVVYAELDDGMVHRMGFRRWTNRLGVPWPYRDEFEVGCTMEHAGYYLTWLVAFFGSARRVTSFASVQVPDKVPGEDLGPLAPDLSIACIEFASGVVARLTCSVLAPHDHSLRIVGDDGVLSTRDCWHYRSPVTSRRLVTVRRRTMLSPVPRRHRLPKGPRLPDTGGAASMDFARGVAEVAASLRERRRSRLPTDLALHVNELTLAIHHAATRPGVHELRTSVEALEPTPLG
jgi:predicted dehydrogenase